MGIESAEALESDNFIFGRDTDNTHVPQAGEQGKGLPRSHDWASLEKSEHRVSSSAWAPHPPGARGYRGRVSGFLALSQKSFWKLTTQAGHLQGGEVLT